eukprot:1139688-Pelagomonas_calceolata.AAC.3
MSCSLFPGLQRPTGLQACTQGCTPEHSARSLMHSQPMSPEACSPSSTLSLEVPPQEKVAAQAFERVHTGWESPVRPLC